MHFIAPSWATRLWGVLGITLALLVSGPPASASAGPYLVKNIKAGSESSYPAGLTALGNVLLFSAAGGGTGRELWRSDGTTSGTYRIKDIRPGGKSSGIEHVTRSGSLVFFTANDGTSGYELWKSDGTASGTSLVKDLVPGGKGSYPRELIDSRGTLYFNNPVTGGLWRSDGTADGTYVVPGTETLLPEWLIAFNGRIAFVAQYGHTSVLWRSDGTAAGTKPMRTSKGSLIKRPSEMAAAGSLLFYTHWNSRLWRSDGTKAGTFQIADFHTDCTYGCDPWMLTPTGGRLFFRQEPAFEGLWTSDGTPAGTVQVAVHPQPLQQLAAVGDDVYFTVDTSGAMPYLWRSEGTELGTAYINVPDLVVPCCDVLYDVGGTLYFRGMLSYESWPLKLWRSDGSVEGTEQIAPSPDNPVFLTLVDGTIFFSAQDSHGRELWAYIL